MVYGPRLCMHYFIFPIFMEIVEIIEIIVPTAVTITNKDFFFH